MDREYFKDLNEFIKGKKLVCAKAEQHILMVGFDGSHYNSFLGCLKETQIYNGTVWFSDGSWGEWVIDNDSGEEGWQHFFFPPIPKECVGIDS